jgi:long-chain acyl-CoA synthetase
MIGVPYVFEQIYHKILASVQEMEEKKQKIFWKALEFGKSICDIEQSGRKIPFGKKIKFSLIKKVVYSSLHARLGGKLSRFLSGAAPLNPETAKFFYAIGVNILEGYGLTETSPVTHCNRLSTTTRIHPSFKFGTVGPLIGWDKDNTKNPYEAVEHKLSPEGELLVRGPNIMMGYWNRIEETKATIEPDGWLHTGDLAEIDSNGYVKIIGRAKEIIVLKTGKKVAPNLIEQIYEENPNLSQIMLIGEGFAYITALIVPNFNRKKMICEKLGVDLSIKNEDFCKHEKIREYYYQILNDAEEGKVSNYERIKKFILIPELASETNGLLTPTLKLKRKKIIEKFFDIIQDLYTKDGSE